MIPFIEISAFLFLCFLSYLDLRWGEIDDRLILLLAIVSFSLIIVSNKLILFVLSVFMLLVGFILWKFKSFGGADVKLLPCLIPIMLYNAPNVFAGIWFYIIILLIIGVLFGLISRFILKKEEVPFIPAMAISYLVFEIFKFFWIGKI